MSKRSYGVPTRKSRRLINKVSQQFSYDTFTSSINFIRIFVNICLEFGYSVPDILNMRLISKNYREAIDTIIDDMLIDYPFEKLQLSVGGPMVDRQYSYNYVWNLIKKIVQKKKANDQFTNLVLLLGVKHFREADTSMFIYYMIDYLNSTNKSIIINDNGPFHPTLHMRLCGVLIIFAGGYFTKDNKVYGFIMYMHTQMCKHIRVMLSSHLQLDHEILNTMLTFSKLPVQDVFTGDTLVFSEADILLCEDECRSYRFYHENEYSLNSGNYKPIYDNTLLVGYPFIENITYPIPLFEIPILPEEYASI